MKKGKSAGYSIILIVLLCFFTAWLPIQDTKKVNNSEVARLIERASELKGNKPQEAMMLAQKALRISVETKDIKGII